MLTPYICVACEKAIYEAAPAPATTGTTGPATLVSLFSVINLTVLENADIPKNAVAPKEWAIFSSWNTEPGDEEKSYFLCTQILYPDLTTFGEIWKAPMLMQRGKRCQMKVQVPGFPIGQEGFYTVRTWIEENKQEVVAPIEFKLEVQIKKQAVPVVTS